MADWLTREQRSRNMSSIRSRGNATTEGMFARVLRGAKITGWRRHPNLPGKPDFVFKQARLVIFIDGCFWHACSRCYRLPQDNRAYWQTKAANNRRRDRLRSRQLRKLGWRVIRVWEHSLKTPRGRAHVVKSLLAILSKRNFLIPRAENP